MVSHSRLLQRLLEFRCESAHLSDDEDERDLIAHVVHEEKLGLEVDDSLLALRVDIYNDIDVMRLFNIFIVLFQQICNLFCCVTFLHVIGLILTDLMRPGTLSIVRRPRSFCW